MKKCLRIIFYCLFGLISLIGPSHAQVDSQKVTLLPQPIQFNAGFDVIIKINGEIVYGIVKEVGLYLILYKRTDIPDGPVYTMYRSEVHAISYRNQVKEYFYPLNTNPIITTARRQSTINYSRNLIFQDGVVRLSLGFIKNFTRVDDVKNYSSSTTFPAINIGYDVKFKDQVRLGLQISFGSRKFSKQDYSTYDSVQNNISINENNFALYVYTRYQLLQNASRVKPYIIGGLGVISSRTKSENTVNFINNNNQSLLVKSGTTRVGLSLLARVGAEYYLTDQFQLFVDGGIGLSIINIGLAITFK